MYSEGLHTYGPFGSGQIQVRLSLSLSHALPNRLKLVRKTEFGQPKQTCKLEVLQLSGMCMYVQTWSNSEVTLLLDMWSLGSI